MSILDAAVRLTGLWLVAFALVLPALVAAIVLLALLDRRR